MYQKITEKDVIEIILKTAEDWQGCGIISPSNIAFLLKTSRYQVNKHIKILKETQLIEYKSVCIGDDEDFYPPYNGYCLSDKGKEKFKNELKTLEEENSRLIKECFGC